MSILIFEVYAFKDHLVSMFTSLHKVHWEFIFIALFGKTASYTIELRMCIVKTFFK